MKFKLLRLSLLSVLAMLCGVGVQAADFRDIKINLMEHPELLTESNVYITVAENGTIGTTENAENAAATIKGKVHSSYGSSNFTASVPVQGCVKITYATHDFGNDIVVTNSEGTEVAKLNTSGAKWMNDHNSVAVAYYRTNAPTTLNFSNANYNPYFAVEAIAPADLPAEVTNYNISFAAGEGATGVAPAALEVETGSKFTAPKNYTLYKEGYTLTGWNDGTKTYVVGEEITPTADMTLTAIYTANEVSLANRTDAVNISFALDGYNANPKYKFEGSTGFIVTQATVNGKVIDVKADVDATSGKFAHNGSGWHQVNKGAKVTIPSAKGAVISVSTYNDESGTSMTFAGNKGTADNKVISYTATAEDATCEIAQVSDNYWSCLTITLPVVSSQEPEEPAGNEQDMTVTWSMANGAESSAVATPENVFMTKSWGMGSNIVIYETTPTATYFDKKFTQFANLEKKDNKRNLLDDNYIEFTIKPYAGVTVTPTTLSFDITKVGTGDPKIWVECIQGTKTITIASEVVIRKNSEATPSESQSFDLTTISDIVASSDATTFRIYIGKLATNKQVALANVKIEGKANGTVETYTTIYNLATAIAAYKEAKNKNIEGFADVLPPTTADPKANAFDLKVDATNGKVGPNADWAQINEGTILKLMGVPQGATVTFDLYQTTGLSIKGVEYTNGMTYTATKDQNLTMVCTTGGYIKTITVEGTAFVDVLDADGYSNTWYFGKSNGAEEFKLEKSAEYTYTVEGRSLVINSSAGKLNNASRTDEWAQCNNGTLFKVPVYAGSKLSWGRYATGSDAGFAIDGKLYNGYYIATEEGTVEMTAQGIGYLSYIKIEPETLYEATGTIEGGSINGSSIILTAAGNGQTYSATISEAAFSVKVPADTYTFDLSDDAPYVVSTPENALINADGNIGVITITAAQPQIVTGTITNAPAEAFTLTFTGNSHTKNVECDANATSYEATLDPDTYTISSSVGELSTLSKASFKVLKAAANHNIYFPEAAVPAATQQNITVDNTATVAANIYNTVTDALAAAKAGNISAPIITLTSGQTYREQVKVDMPNVTLKTSGDEKATITFYYGIGYTYYSLGEDGYYNKDRANTRNSILMKDPTRWGATVLVTSKGTNFKAENIIFENSFNQYYTTEEVVDGVRPNGLQSIKYDRTLAEGAEKYQAADTKAVTERAAAIAFENNPTGVQLYNCTFIGSQDTFYSSGKIYVKNSNLIGNTDYIFGGGLVVFDNCDLTIGGYSDKETTAYITAYKDGDKLDANKTYIFRDCTVKKGNRTYVLANLGRDWGGKAASVHYFNLKNELGDKLKFQWTDMGGGVTAGTANLHIYDFDPTINANYNTTGASGANVNGVLSDENALSLYAGVVAKLGFTPERIYEDVVELGESSAYNVCRIAANNTIKRNVKVSRTLNANEWNTIILPFALTAEQIAEAFGAESKVAELTTADNTTLNFTTVTAMEANTPYIINVSNNLVSATINDVTIVKDEATKTVGDWTETGSYTAATLPAASYFFNEGNVCKTTGDDTAITALNVYFTNSAADAVTFTVDGKATGINTIQTAVDNINGIIYNLSGQRVNKATRGLYIVNGKKVVIK